MPTSDEDLQAKSDEVQKLREQVAEEEAKREAREVELSNDVTMTQLQAEEANLQARLTLAKQAGKAGSVKSGAAAPLDAAKEQMRVAVEQQKAAEKTVEAKEKSDQEESPPPVDDPEALAENTPGLSATNTGKEGS